jgi:hypothetical protein
VRAHGYAGETEYDAASIVGERVSCSGRSLSQFNLASDATDRQPSRSFQSQADEQKSDDEWVEGARRWIGLRCHRATAAAACGESCLVWHAQARRLRKTR